MAELAGPKCHPHGITGYGNPDSKVVMVGIAPGQDEVRTGRPFTGPSGQLLDAILQAVGWSRSEVYCTNLICWYKDDPTQSQINECLPRLVAEIAERKPKLIVPLGTLASQVFTGYPIGKVRGHVMYNDMFRAYVLPTYHTSAVLRGNNALIHNLVRDLGKIPDVLDDHYEQLSAPFDWHVLTDAKQAQAVLDQLPRNTPIAIDIEVDSPSDDQVDVYNDRLLCVGFSDGKVAWVLPADVAKAVTWPNDVQWLAHNGSFDLQGLKRHVGASLTLAEDTMMQSYSLDERQGVHSMETLGQEFLGVENWKSWMAPYKRRGFGEAPDQLLFKYNAHDVAYEARLFHVLKRRQAFDGVGDRPYRLLVDAMNAFAEINERGVHIHPGNFAALATEWGLKYLEDEQRLVDQASELGFPGRLNLNSSRQVAHIVHELLELPVVARTPTGLPSTKADVLKELEGQHPFVDGLQDFRHLDHMLGTYILGLEDDLKGDGCVHPDTLLHGTVTGRTSYRRPPLQTIPKEHTLGTYGRIRSIFAPRDKNHVIVEADLKTAEVWCMWYESRDPQMLDDLLSGDYHGRTVLSVYKKTKDQCDPIEWEHLRYMTKFITFGIAYGREANSLGKGELKCPSWQAQRYIDNWFGRYPVYSKWWQDTQRRAVDDGELISVTGRKRRFRLVRGEEGYKALKQAVNFPIQSMASDIKLLSLIELNQTLRPLDSYVLFEVHDCIVFEVSKDHFDQAVSTIAKTMSRGWFPDFPGVPVEVKVGENWHDTKVIDL